MYFAAVMALSIRVDNQSLVDIFWGPGFVLVAVVSFVASRHAGGDEVRRLVVLALTAVWGLRLGLHIGVRNIGHGQDPRYTAIMSHRSGSLAGYVARKIYGPQAVILFVVSLPVQFAMYQRSALGVLGALGITVWTVGFVFEALGDYQLSRFKKDPANAGLVMDRGLWSWSRHPNYFGELGFWFSMALFGVAAAPADWWWLFIGVAAMLAMFLGASIPLMEKRSLERRPNYQAVIDRVPRLVPRPPRRAAV